MIKSFIKTGLSVSLKFFRAANAVEILQSVTIMIAGSRSMNLIIIICRAKVKIAGIHLIDPRASAAGGVEGIMAVVIRKIIIEGIV